MTALEEASIKECLRQAERAADLLLCCPSVSLYLLVARCLDTALANVHVAAQERLTRGDT